MLATEPSSGTAPARKTLPFFVLALGITWLFQAPALLARHGWIPGSTEDYLLPAALGGFGPLLAALIAARLEKNAGAGRGSLQPLLPSGVGAGWYALSLLLFPALYVGGAALFRAFGGSGASWLYPPENAQQVAAMLVIPLVEEPGWRGFALPRLQERYSPLRASLVLGVAWALWHVVMFLLQGMGSLVPFTMAMVNVVLGSVIFSWLYGRTRGSLLVAIFAHVGVHLNNPFHALPSNLTPFIIYTTALGVTAVVLVLADRAVFCERRTEPARGVIAVG